MYFDYCKLVNEQCLSTHDGNKNYNKMLSKLINLLLRLPLFNWSLHLYDTRAVGVTMRDLWRYDANR